MLSSQVLSYNTAACLAWHMYSRQIMALMEVCAYVVVTSPDGLVIK